MAIRGRFAVIGRMMDNRRPHGNSPEEQMPANHQWTRKCKELGGPWYAFNPRHNVPRIARVLAARGRDAAEVALTTAFGVNHLEAFKVWTDQVSHAGKR